MAVAISDGKIIAAGRSNNGSNDDIAVVRYNNDGSLDNSFDSDGIATTEIYVGYDRAYDLAIQPDGKIVAIGWSHNASTFDIGMVRYNSNGSLDNSFGNNGKVITPVGSSNDYSESLAIQWFGQFFKI